jgi:hypothetical protein
MAGQAKKRGTKEERIKQALAKGIDWKTGKQYGAVKKHQPDRLSLPEALLGLSLAPKIFTRW